MPWLRIFPCGEFLFSIADDCLSKCPNSKKTSVPLKIHGYAPGDKFHTQFNVPHIIQDVLTSETYFASFPIFS